MTIQEALRFGHEKLHSTLPYPEQAWKEAEILLAFVLQQERVWLVAHGEETLLKRRQKRFISLIERRIQHEPLAYLIGSAEFCGHMFEVNKYVLIPRIETEELVEKAAAGLSFRLRGNDKKKQDPQAIFWDVGTGSGVIATSIKDKFPMMPVIASDVSGRALAIAKKNATRLLLPEHQPTFIQGSLLTTSIKQTLLKHGAKTLIVLANLPYLPHSDKNVLQKDVVAYEPSFALFADEEGNALILKLAKQLAKFIKEYPLSLTAYFEFDPPQAKTLKEKMQRLFPEASVTIHRDACGRERFLFLNTSK